MAYDLWIADARQLQRELPVNSTAYPRVDYLLTHVAPQGIEAAVVVDDQGEMRGMLPDASYDPQKNFLVVDRDSFVGADMTLRDGITSTASAFVARKGRSTILGLGTPNASEVATNAGVLLHELTHITEDEVGFPAPDCVTDQVQDIGARERRAYAFNRKIFSSFDEDAYTKYALQVSRLILERGIFSTNAISSDDYLRNLFRPPRNTMLDECWSEGSIGRVIILVAFYIKHLETAQKKLGEDGIDRLVGKTILGVT